MSNKFFGFLYAMNYISQTAWSFVFPAGLIVGLGLFLRWKFDLGQWIVIVAVIFGVLSGVCNMFRYMIRMADYSTGEFNKKNKKNKKK